jgi:tRNA(Ile)-lysidine synthase
MSTIRPTKPIDFEQCLAAAWPPEQWCDVSVVVAVSGGPDSVALLCALAALKTTGPGRLWAAHFNHRLRGPEADKDQAFVGQLCQRLEIACHMGQAELSVTTAGDGLEAAARQERYTFLQDVALQCGARFVVTAHTADDQAETILHRIVRGTGIAGLAGMRRARPLGAVTLLRPLLEIGRADVEAYLAEIGQPARFDQTNADCSFTRNRIRHELLPLLTSQFNPAVGQALCRLGQLAADAQDALRPQVEALLKCVVASGGVSDASVRLDCRPLQQTPVHLVRELFATLWQQQSWPLQAMDYVAWQSLAEMALASEPTLPQRMLPGKIAAQKKGGELLLSRLS